MKKQIPCKVFPGQFSSEYAITAFQADGSKFSLFAPVSAVTPEETPTRNHEVDGWLTVNVWENLGHHVVVQLPRESFESGRFVTVDASTFRDPSELAFAS